MSAIFLIEMHKINDMSQIIGTTLIELLHANRNNLKRLGLHYGMTAITPKRASNVKHSIPQTTS